MRRIKTFAELFEGGSKRIDDFKLNIKMPTTQRELDEIMELPEAKMLMDMNKIKNPGYTPIFLKHLMRLLPKSGSVQINAGFGYPFKITQSGKLYYGSYPIAPSANFEIKNWQNLLDFAIVYLITLGLSTNAIEKFVFEGGKIQPKLLDRLERTKFSEIALQIAKKYNSPDKIDRIVDEAKKESQKFITDLEPILETETYKTLDKIYALTSKIKEVGGRSTMLINIGNRTPYGIADAFSRFSYTSSNSLNINVGADALISVKTLRGLERAFKSEISRIILWRNEMAFERYPFDRLFYDMNKFTFDNIDSGITKEMLVKKFGDDIRRTIIQTAKNNIDKISKDLKSGISLSSWQVKEMESRGEAIVEFFDFCDDAGKKIITEMVVKEFNELNNLDFLKFLPEEFRKKIMSGMGKGSKEVSDLMDLGF